MPPPPPLARPCCWFIFRTSPFFANKHSTNYVVAQTLLALYLVNRKSRSPCCSPTRASGTPSPTRSSRMPPSTSRGMTRCVRASAEENTHSRRRHRPEKECPGSFQADLGVLDGRSRIMIDMLGGFGQKLSSVFLFFIFPSSTVFQLHLLIHPPVGGGG